MVSAPPPWASPRRSSCNTGVIVGEPIPRSTIDCTKLWKASMLITPLSSVMSWTCWCSSTSSCACCSAASFRSLSGTPAARGPELSLERPRDGDTGKGSARSPCRSNLPLEHLSRHAHRLMADRHRAYGERSFRGAHGGRSGRCSEPIASEVASLAERCEATRPRSDRANARFRSSSADIARRVAHCSTTGRPRLACCHRIREARARARRTASRARWARCRSTSATRWWPGPLCCSFPACCSASSADRSSVSATCL